nr:MAG TPA: hypothetical protein [Caudoviricetes sp.]
MGNGPLSYLLKELSCISITSLRPPKHSHTYLDLPSRLSFTSVTTVSSPPFSFSLAGSFLQAVQLPRGLTSSTSQRSGR